MKNDGIFYLLMVLTFIMQISITAKYKSYISFGDKFILTYDVGLYALSLNLIFVMFYFMIKLDGISTEEFKKINSNIMKLEGHLEMKLFNKLRILIDTLFILNNNTKYVYTEIVFKILIILNNALILLIL